MQTRRDLYQAHKLMMQRVGLALLQGEPDVSESPMRRSSVAAFSGVMVAVLIAAVFGVIGLLRPGGANGLDKGGTVIIEKETGTKYVYDTNTKRMLPVANYASAKLALNNDNAPQRVVSRKSLSKFTRGPLIGIQGAPDSLPDPDHLVRKPWSVCVRNGKTSADATRPTTSLVAGKNVGGRPLGPGEALYVQGDDQQGWVVLANRRMPMELSPAAAQGVTHVPPTTVTSTWLNAVPQANSKFRPPPVQGRGGTPNFPAGTGRIGQVFQSSTGGVGTGGKYVLLADGFAPIEDTQAQLLLGDPATQQEAYGGQPPRPISVSQATVNQNPSATHLDDRGLPPTMPKFRQWSTATPACAVYANTDKGSTNAQVTVGGNLRDVTPAGGGGKAVDQVLLPPGGAALVGLLPSNGQLSAVNNFYIVNDEGISFPLSSKDVVKKLGYDVSEAAPVPQAILHLIPTGPTLDPAAAAKPLVLPGAKPAG